MSSCFRSLYTEPSLEATPPRRSNSPPPVKEPLMMKSGGRSKRQQPRPPSARPRSLAYFGSPAAAPTSARDYEALVSPAAEYPHEDSAYYGSGSEGMNRTRSVTALPPSTSTSTSGGRLSPSKKTSTSSSKSSSKRQYRSDMQLDSRTPRELRIRESGPQLRQRRRLSSSGDNSSFYFNDGSAVLDDAMSSDSEL